MNSESKEEADLVSALRGLAEDAPPFPGLIEPVRDHRRIRTGPLIAAAAVAAVVAGTSWGLVARDARTSSETDKPGTAVDGTSSTPTPLPGLASRDDVRAAADPLAGLYEREGFGRVALDFETAEVRVWWKGRPPAAVIQAAGVNDDGVRVVVIPAPFSDSELRAAAQRLAEAATGVEVTINTIGQARDLSGLVVYVSEVDLRSIDTAAVSAQLSQAAQVPVSMASGGEYHPQ